MEKQNLRETALFTTLTVYVYSIFILEANHETFWWKRCKKIGGMQNSWIQEVKNTPPVNTNSVLSFIKDFIQSILFS